MTSRRPMLRRGLHAAASLAPLTFVFIPVVGMIWISSRQQAPPVISVIRIVVALALVVLGLYAVLRRRSTSVATGALGTSLLVLGFYPAAHAAARAAAWNDVTFAWAYLAGCVVVGAAVARLPTAGLAAVNDILAPVAVVFCVFAGGLIARVYVAPPSYAPEVAAAVGNLSSPLRLPQPPRWRPDVYDLVLDGMGRSDVLERDYGVRSNGLDRWRTLGFRIAAAAHANYLETQLSLASMLNLDYLDALALAEGHSNERGPLTDLISNARVPAAFKALGYSVEYIGSGYLSSGAFVMADRCDCLQLWFADAEVGTLSLSPFQVLSPGIGNRAHYERSLRVFNEFERTRTGTAPRYVFAHVPMPHPPFLTDEQGRFNHSRKPLSGGDGAFFPGGPDEYRSGYRAQALFTLSRAYDAVSRILDDEARHGRDAIILVHGDHGPRLGLDASHPSTASVKRALPILLAIRWPANHRPGPDEQGLVNVYRAIFREAFGANLPPLADRSYISSFNAPYVLTPVPR